MRPRQRWSGAVFHAGSTWSGSNGSQRSVLRFADILLDPTLRCWLVPSGVPIWSCIFCAIIMPWSYRCRSAGRSS